MKKKPDVLVNALVYNDQVAYPVSLYINYPVTDSESIDCGFLPEDTNFSIQSASLQDEEAVDYVQIRSKDVPSTIWVPRMRIERQEFRNSSTIIRGVADLFFEGDIGWFDSKVVAYECFVAIQDMDLFSYSEDLQTLGWNSQFGRFELPLPTRNFKVLHSPDVYRFPKKHVIQLKSTGNGSNSAQDFLQRLANYLDEIMVLLSFMSRKYLHWYQIDAFIVSEDGLNRQERLVRGRRDSSIVRRNISADDESWNFPSRILVNPETLQKEVLGTIIQSFLSSPNRRVLTHVISIILATYSANLIEQDLGLIHTALEALVNEHTSKNLFSKADYRTLKDALIAHIPNISNLNLSDPLLAELEEKMLELNRRSYRTRVLELLEPVLKSIPLDKSQIASVEDLQNALSEALKRRNQYVHGKQIDDYFLAQVDIATIRLLLNVWILNHLGYPLQELDLPDKDLQTIASYVFAKRKMNGE